MSKMYDLVLASMKEYVKQHQVRAFSFDNVFPLIKAAAIGDRGTFQPGEKETFELAVIACWNKLLAYHRICIGDLESSNWSIIGNPAMFFLAESAEEALKKWDGVLTANSKQRDG